MTIPSNQNSYSQRPDSFTIPSLSLSLRISESFTVEHPFVRSESRARIENSSWAKEKAALQWLVCPKRLRHVDDWEMVQESILASNHWSLRPCPVPLVFQALHLPHTGWINAGDQLRKSNPEVAGQSPGVSRGCGVVRIFSPRRGPACMWKNRKLSRRSLRRWCWWVRSGLNSYSFRMLWMGKST